MKRKENLKIGNEFFTYKKNIDKYYNYFNEYKTLDECYNSYSTYKYNAYKYYEELIYKNADRVIAFGVRSYNSMQFTLHAIIEKEGKRYYLLITKSYNYYKEYEGNYED